MIKITRTAEPKVLKLHSKKWEKEYIAACNAYDIDPSEKNKITKNSLERKYNHKEIKNELIRVFNGKCCYCESHVTHVSFAHIEHYKPKSKYPKLCFKWSNLFLGCAVCNSPTYKSDKWFTSSKGGPFINPETENPNQFFDFNFDHITGKSIVKPKGKRAKKTEENLGLNRLELLHHRNGVVEKVAFIAIRAKKGDKDALALLRACTNSDQEYSAFAKAFVRKFKINI